MWSVNLTLVCLVTLTATFFGLTLYSILQSNAGLLPIGAARYLSVKILDTSSAATLFVTLLGALLVRHQFAMSLVPRINYRSSNTTRTDVAHPGATFDTWRVEILNSGLGAAIIKDTIYSIELTGERSTNLAGHHQQIVGELTKAGLVRNKDYWLTNLTTGFALSPKDDFVVFEIKREYLTKIKCLNMALCFQSQLGSQYRREIFLLPRTNTEFEKQNN